MNWEHLNGLVLAEKGPAHPSEATSARAQYEQYPFNTEVVRRTRSVSKSGVATLARRLMAIERARARRHGALLTRLLLRGPTRRQVSHGRARG